MNRSVEFSVIRDEAHRRSTPPCGAPAFVRFRGWWVNPARKPFSDYIKPSNPTITEDELLQPIEDELQSERSTIIDFYTSIADKFRVKLDNTTVPIIPKPKLTSLFTRPSKIPSVSETSINFTALWRQLQIEISITINSDYISLSQIIDLSGRAKGLKQCELSGVDVTQFSLRIKNRLKTIGSILSSLEQYRNNEDERYRQIQIHRDTLKSDYQEFFTNIWDPFDGDFGLNDIFDTNSSDEEQHVELFCDFRGLILFDQIEKNVNYKHPHALRGEYTHQAFSGNNDRATLHRYWPFIKSAPNGLSKSEVIACTVLDRTALYVSTLGHHSRNNRDSDGDPINYLVVTSTSSRWQIGRLVDRINRLGTYRLIALRNLQKLSSANLEIQAMGDVLDRLENAISRQQDSSDIVRICAHILNRIGSNTDGGLSYRVYRSRYYVNYFKTVIPDLRIDRIEGFQPYDAFVRRRLFGRYEFIDRLGQRLEQLRERFRTILEANQSQALFNINQSLLESHNTATNLLNDVKSLLSVGHIVEMIAVAYYGGVIISYLTIGGSEVLARAIKNEPMLHVIEENEHFIQALISIGVLVTWRKYEDWIRKLLGRSHRP